MRRMSFLRAVPVACVFACGDATQPAPPPPFLTVPAFAMADVPAGGPAWTACVVGTQGWVNYIAEPHFVENDSMSGALLPYTIFADAEEPPNQCGDLDFNGRTRSFRTWYATDSTHGEENPWKYWWRRSRRASNGSGDLYAFPAIYRPGHVFAWDTVYVPVSEEYDAVGVVLVLNSQADLDIDEDVFTDASQAYGDINLVVQHWAHRAAPTFVSASRSGRNAILTWNNEHAGRTLDSTNIYRDGAYLTTVGPSDTSYVDSSLADGPYAYSLKHISFPAAFTSPNGVAPYPNSPASDTLSVTIPNLSVSISGPGYLWTPRKYTWTSSVTGGTTPYSYVWWLDPFGPGGPTQVGTSGSYTRNVTYQDLGFTLTLVVTDADQLTGADTLSVFTDWGYGPMTGRPR